MNREVPSPAPDDHSELVRSPDPDAPLSVPTMRVAPSKRNGNGHAAAAPPGAEPPRDIYREALLALRGRYVLAVVLAVLGAAAGVAAVVRFVSPLYRSQGLVQISFNRAVVLDQTWQNAPMPMVDSFFRGQIQVIYSLDLLERAMRTKAWQPTGITPSVQSLAELQEMLTVDHPTNTDHLRFVYTHENPHVAAAAVNAMIEAYAAAYESRDQSEFEKLLELLQKQEETDRKRLNEANAKLAAASQDGGANDLEVRYQSVLQRLNILESQLQAVDLGLELKAAAPTTAPGSDDHMAERIAMQQDPAMRELLKEQDRLEAALEEGRARWGRGDNFPDMIEMRRKLNVVKANIDRYADTFRDLQGQIQYMAGLMQPQGRGNLPTTPLDRQKQVMTRLRDQAQSELQRLGIRKQEVVQLNADVIKFGQQLEKVQDRIRQVRVESGFGSRLNVISQGETPLRPFYDPRRKYVVVAAGVGGGLPVALLVLLGLASGKYRFVQDAEEQVARKTPLLGMLPSLPDSLRDMRLAADAAHSVHHIRVMLQTGPQSKGRSVYMVTSACAGEGKTNLTVALGLSFSAAGCRTLVIDCDLVGQGVTRGFRAERTTGLREALDSGTARGFVKKLPQGLRILTAGNADTVSGWTLSPTATHRMLAEVRRYYDVVLIDTGPILGSVEASILAPEVDGVIVTISRGQQRALVDRAMNRLHSLGADPIGFVFNRAQGTDSRYTSYHSVRSRTSSNTLPQLHDQETSEVSGFGPLVRSVASFMRTPTESNSE